MPCMPYLPCDLQVLIRCIPDLHPKLMCRYVVVFGARATKFFYGLPLAAFIDLGAKPKVSASPAW
jgi:hypothetical protein